MAKADTYITQTGIRKPVTPKPTALDKEIQKPIKDAWTAPKPVAGHQRVAHQDGHDVNEHYKIPSAHPAGRDNLSYMHPQVEPLNLNAILKTADPALSETHRPDSQMGRSKTVFPVNQGKVRGAPSSPQFARATRAKGTSPVGITGKSNIF